VPKKAVIVISLIDESLEKPDKDIEREIFEELLKHPPTIPWMKAVVMVKVTKA